jgi:single-strand DNA-binding protein
MLNKVFLQGRLVADPELRHTPNGAAVATFRMAVDRDFKSKNPDEPTADFVNIVAWRNTAEFVSRYFTKGRMALVEGRLQIRSYNDKEGNRRSVTEVVADSIHFCDSKRDSEGGGGNYGGGYAPAPSAYAPPAAPAPSAPAQASGGFADLDDDGELPF